MKAVLRKIKAILVDLACEDELPLDMTTFDTTLLEPAFDELVSNIDWRNSRFSNKEIKAWDGMVNGKLMFAIDQKGKRNPVYVLKSYPFDNGIFTRANNSKVLFEHADLNTVCNKADEYLKQYVNLFLKQS